MGLQDLIKNGTPRSAQKQQPAQPVKQIPGMQSAVPQQKKTTEDLFPSYHKEVEKEDQKEGNFLARGYKAYVRNIDRAASAVNTTAAQTGASLVGGINFLANKVQNITGNENYDGFLDRIAKSAQEKADRFSTGQERALNIQEEDKDTFVYKMASAATSAATFYVPGIGIVKGIGLFANISSKLATAVGVAASTALESATEAGEVYDDVYQQMLTKGKSESEARKTADTRASAVFGVNALVVGLTNKYGGIFEDMPAVMKRKLLSYLVSGGSEALQETIQTVTSNVATGRPWDEGIKDAALYGGLTGAGMRLTTNALGTSQQGTGIAPNLNRLITPESTPGIQEDKKDEIKVENNSFGEKDSISYNLLVKDTSDLLMDTSKEQVQEAIEKGFGVSSQEAQEVISKAEEVVNTQRIKLEVAQAKLEASNDIQSRVSRESLLAKVKEIDSQIDENSAKETADVLNRFFDPRKTTFDQKQYMATVLSQNEAALRILEEYTGLRRPTAEDIEDYLSMKDNVFYTQAESDVLSQLQSAQGSGVAFDENTNTYKRFKSGLPDWIPPELKTVQLAQSVAAYIEKGKLPPARATRQRELYDLVQEKIKEVAEFNKEQRTFTYSELKTDGIDDIPFKIKSRVVKEVELITNEQAEAIVRQYFTAEELPVVFMDKILTNRGGEAWGAYSKGVIKFVNNTSKETPTHEAVHAFLDLFVPFEKKQAYIKEAIRDYKQDYGLEKFRSEVRKVHKNYAGLISMERAEMIFGEEVLADGFIMYIKQRNATKEDTDTNPRTISQMLRDFFDSVINFIDSMVNPNSADKLYEDIIAKKRASFNYRKYAFEQVNDANKNLYGDVQTIDTIALERTEKENKIDGTKTVVYSAPSRTVKVKGKVGVRRVQDDSIHNEYVDAYAVTANKNVFGMFKTKEEAEVFAENVQEAGTGIDEGFATIITKLDRDNKRLYVQETKGITKQAIQRAIREEMFFVHRNLGGGTLVLPESIGDLFEGGVRKDGYFEFPITASPSTQALVYSQTFDVSGIVDSVISKINGTDLRTMVRFIDYSKGVENGFTDSEYANAEEIAQMLKIKMDLGLGRVGELFVQTLQGSRPIPKNSIEMFKTKDVATDPLFEEAKKYKNADEFVKFMRGSATQYGEYNPRFRAKVGLSEDSARLSDLGVDPNKEIVVYRGIDGDISGAKINDGDFVTTDLVSAKGYSSGKVLSKKVKAKDLITDSAKEFDVNDPFYTGAEFVYSDSKNKLTNYTKYQLEDIWKQANSEESEMYQMKDDPRDAIERMVQKYQSRFTVVNNKLVSFNEVPGTQPIEVTGFEREIPKSKSRSFEKIKESLEAEYQVMNVPYTPITLNDQIAKAQIFVKQDYDKAVQIALGYEIPPLDVSDVALSQAVLEAAREKGDNTLVAQITMAQSQRATRRGQDLVAQKLLYMDQNSSEFFVSTLLERKKELARLKYKPTFSRQTFNQVFEAEKEKVRKKLGKGFSEKTRVSLKEAQDLIDSLVC